MYYAVVPKTSESGLVYELWEVKVGWFGKKRLTNVLCELGVFINPNDDLLHHAPVKTYPSVSLAAKDLERLRGDESLFKLTDWRFG